MSAIGAFVAGVVGWFALLCAIGLAFELHRARAVAARQTMRARIARHIHRR